MKPNCQHCSDSRDDPKAPADQRRRRLVELAVLGGGVSVLAAARAETSKPSATEALLLSCMDYRLMDDVARHMTDIGLTEGYDHIVLAGASLGAVTHKFPAWNQTFWEHLQIALKLHGIKRVILLDHRDCGAYKVLLGPAHTRTRDLERREHEKQLTQLAGQIRKKHPTLIVEAKLMDLDGKVEVVALPGARA